MNQEKIKSFLDGLGINQPGRMENDSYIIVLPNSNAYSKVYTILDKSDQMDLDIDKINMDENTSSMTYLSDDFDITLTADFDKDSYTMELTEAND